MEDNDFLELEDVFRKIVKKMPSEWRKQTKLGFTRSEALIIHTLHVEGPQRASALAKALSITTGGLTGITDKLVEGNYIVRVRDDKDRRVVYLQTTEKGKEAFHEMKNTRKAFIEHLFQDISAEERHTFKTISKKILTNFDSFESDE